MMSPTSSDNRRIVSKPPTEHHRACKVCGDRANGFNFGVLTCESCKAFFRRNAAKELEIKCPFADSCGITAASRRFCQACRLKKCFTVGMNRDWLNEGAPKPAHKAKRKMKREDTDDSDVKIENDPSSEDEVSVSKAYLNDLIRRAKRPLTSCECECSCGFYSPGTRLVAAPPINDPRPSPSCSSSVGVPSPLSRPMPSPVGHAPSPLRPSPYSVQSPGQPQTPFGNCVQMPTARWGDMAPHGSPLLLPNQFSLPYGLPPLPASVIQAFSPIPTPQLHPQHPQTSMSEMPIMSPNSFPNITDMDPQMKLSLDEYNKIICRPRPLPIERFSRLSAKDSQMLQEIVRAAEPLNQPLELSFADGNPLSIEDVVRITETALTRIVCTTRDLPPFNTLPMQDKLELVKGCCCELMIIRGVMAFDLRKQTWSHSFLSGAKDMEVNLDVLKNFSNDKHYEDHKSFLEKFDPRLRNCESVMSVLMAMTVFNPEKKLIDKETVMRTRKEYSSLLLRVVECQFGSSEAPQLFDLLQSYSRDLRELGEGLIKVYSVFDSHMLHPLIKELIARSTTPNAAI